MTVYRPDDRRDVVWMHPGEPVFDRVAAAVVDRYGTDGLRGAVFVDPNTTEPYLFHIALVTVESGHDRQGDGSTDARAVMPLDSRLVGLRQMEDGIVEECPVEHLLLLRGAGDFAPGQAPIAALARRLSPTLPYSLATEYRAAGAVPPTQDRRRAALRLEFVNRGFDFYAAELAAARARLTDRARSGDPGARVDLARVKTRQRGLSLSGRVVSLSWGRRRTGSAQARSRFLVHALAVPAQNPRTSIGSTPRWKRSPWMSRHRGKSV